MYNPWNIFRITSLEKWASYLIFLTNLIKKNLKISRVTTIIYENWKSKYISLDSCKGDNYAHNIPSIYDVRQNLDICRIDTIVYSTLFHRCIVDNC